MVRCYANLPFRERSLIKSLVTDIPPSKVSNIIKRKSGRGFYVATENEGIYDLVYRNKGFAANKLNTEINLTGDSIHSMRIAIRICGYVPMETGS